MDKIQCKYCNNFFKTNNNLKTHQQTAKYCIGIQKKENGDIDIKLKNCEYCSKIFAWHMLDRHLKVCKNKKNILKKEADDMLALSNKEKDDEISLLKKQIDDVKKEADDMLALLNKEKDDEISLLKKQIDNVKKEADDMVALLNKEKDDEISLLKKQIDDLKKELEFQNILSKKEKKYTDFLSENYEKQLNKKNQEINGLQNRLEKLAVKAIEKPTNSTSNTIINNLPAFHTQEFINNKIQDKFDDRYFHNEMKSIAQFTYDHILTLDNGNLVYVCSDYGRKNFKYKDKDGIEITDPEAIKLIGMIQDKLYDKTCYLHDWAVNEYDYLKMQEERDEIIDKKELDNVIDMIGKAQDMKCVIKSMNKTKKFSNELAKLTIVKK